jgi:hypothetical protein
MAPTIWAYTQIHNSWPLAGLAIVHHVEVMADIVVVADHASTDQSRAGLHELKQRYGSRLIIVDIPPSDFHQDIFANLILHALPISDGDWVFAFDGDEFLMTDSELGKLLAEVPPNVRCLTIPVLNHLSITDFDSGKTEMFRKLGYRKASLHDSPGAEFQAMVNRIESLEASYFDYPFENKVVVRWSHDVEWTVGAHSVRGIHASQQLHLSDGEIYIAHFPMLEWPHLLTRADYGHILIEQGKREDFTWQSQIAARLQDIGLLPQFWERNSVPSDPSLVGEGFVFNEKLNLALNTAVDFFTGKAEPSRTQPISAETKAAAQEFEDTFNVTNAVLDALIASQRNLKSIKASPWWMMGRKLAGIARSIRREH